MPRGKLGLVSDNKQNRFIVTKKKQKTGLCIATPGCRGSCVIVASWSKLLSLIVHSNGICGSDWDVESPFYINVLLKKQLSTYSITQHYIGLMQSSQVFFWCNEGLLVSNRGSMLKHGFNRGNQVSKWFKWMGQLGPFIWIRCVGAGKYLKHAG